eukprot:m.34739 g.34739  ORF g.34739 m.34739 type:complete len:224 (+) comp12336_c0_seq1:136-807(+)
MLSRRQRLCAKSKCQSSLQPIQEVASPEAVVSVAFSTQEPVAAPSTNIRPLAVMSAPEMQPSSPVTLRQGPSKPNFKRLLELANKTQEEVAQALGIDQAALANLLSNKVDAVERWAPVFAKAALMSRKGMLKLLGASADVDPRPASVGETIYWNLKRRSEQTLEQCRQALMEGWRGWERYRLTEEQLSDFFQGKSKEAEEVGRFLVKLGMATNLSSLFALFAR